MSTLFTFGCSYTEDYRTNLISNYTDYKSFKGGIYPDSWPKILADKLGYDIKNYGQSATGNYQIFHRFCQQVNEIKKGDIVIIEWTYMNRYRWVNMSTNKWIHLGVGLANVPDITESTHSSICINRTSKLYLEEIFDFQNVIDRLSESIGFEIYYWSCDVDLIYPIPKKERRLKKYLISDYVSENNETTFDEVFRRGGKRIFEETNGLINDNHFGESAHKVMAELYYDHIINFI